MAKLLDIENNGTRLDKTYMHYGEDGRKKLTTVMTMDAEPVFRAVKETKQNSKSKDFMLKAHVDEVTLTDFVKKTAVYWGCGVKDAFSEMMTGKTDRAKKAWKILTEGRDFRKFQAKHY